MMPAQEQLAADLFKLVYSDFASPIIHNVNAAVNNDASNVCDALTRQVSSPVRWLQSVQRAVKDGVDTFVELPGKVVSGIVSRSTVMFGV